jgi:methionyl-tRNA formyltransferase
MRDDTTGLTVFWVDEGIDTGPILLQRECPIGPDDTVGSLYFDRLYPMGVEALVDAVRMVREGAARREPQDEARATYEPPAEDANSGIDWSRPAEEVYALIRGSNPQPGAHAMLRGGRVRIFDCRLAPSATGGLPGMVTAMSDDGVDVALAGGTLRILRLQPDGGKKMTAADAVAAGVIGSGDRFEDGRA